MKAGSELAWRQLIKQKGYFAAAVSGVAFTVALMFSQIGLRDSLVNASIGLYRHLSGDIFMTSWEYHSQGGIPTVPNRRFTEVLGIEGVATCFALHIGPVRLRNPQTLEHHHITLVGFDTADDLWDFTDQGANFQRLKVPGTILFDQRSRNLYGPLKQTFITQGRVWVAVSQRRVSIVGLISIGPGFNHDGYILSSDVTYAQLSGAASLLPVLGAIRLKGGANRQQVLDRLRLEMPNDVRFVQKEDFLEQEKAYWLTHTPVGILFTAVLILGLVVGAVFVYQILYTDVTNHLPEYATMKAMGYSDAKLFRLVIIQALYISMLGFVPGALIARVIFVFLQDATLLPFAITFVRLWEVYLLTLTMCGISGAIAMLALRAADPAEIF